MSLIDEEILTKGEMISEILDKVSDQLWSGDCELIAETAKLVGIKITGYHDSNARFKLFRYKNSWRSFRGKSKKDKRKRV